MEIMKAINPILLAGGSGTRLWPLSRKTFPKQFVNFNSEKSLFQHAALRLMSSATVNFAPHITITNSDFRFIVVEQLQEMGVDPGSILIEPSAKNTAPAVLAASIYAAKDDPNALILIAPADHAINDVQSFHEAIKTGLAAVEQGNLVTFGIQPTHAETGYGYLELGENPNHNFKPVSRFVEKPNYKHALEMFEDDRYLWNSGIFMFRACDLLEAFEKYKKMMLLGVRKAVEGSVPDLGFLRLEVNSWEDLENISLDYAIMEKAENIVAVPFSAGWSDLGGWDAVLKGSKLDENGVAVSENAHSIDCQNSLLRSESASQQIVGLGLKDIIAVAMPDAVLVADKERAQDVKSVVEKLKALNVHQAEIFPKDHRPWGWFESIALGDRFQVKRIFVKPGAALSLQSHHHRSEHWIVVEGTAKVTLDDDVKLVSEGESIYIPIGASHRMENPGKLPMLLIEVQTGSYLGEDDIVRYEDLYKRS